MGINYSEGRGAGRGDTSRAGAAQPQGPGSSCSSTVCAGCREQLPQDRGRGPRHCHMCQLTLALGTNGAQPWCGDTLGPAGAGAALDIAGSPASTGCGAGRGRRLLLRAGAPARRGPAPPARQHVTKCGAANWATAHNRSWPRAGEARRARAGDAAGPGDAPAAGREPRACWHREGLTGSNEAGAAPCGADPRLPPERAEATWQHPLAPALKPKPGGGSTHRHPARAHRAPDGRGCQVGTRGTHRQ